MGERTEALLRIPLAIVNGVLLAAWGLAAALVALAHWFHALIPGRRHKGIVEFTNRFIAYDYEVHRYLDLVTNRRPWPIGKRRSPLPRPVNI
jgi:hypothetical protein